MLNKSYFHRSGYIQDSIIKTDSGSELDMLSLPPFLRTLMVMDGTVTKSLSAWFWEPVEVIPLVNRVDESEQKIEDLNVENKGEVLCREVALVGEHSHQTFAYARSTLLLTQLPEKIGLSLINGEIGIGELLRKQGIETYREIFHINYYVQEDLVDDSLLSNLSGGVVSRSYKIRVNGVPSIIVTEYFPLEVYS